MRSELDLMKEKKDQIWTRREKEENKKRTRSEQQVNKKRTRREKEENKKRTKMNEKRNIEMNLTETEPVSEAANYAT